MTQTAAKKIKSEKIKHTKQNEKKEAADRSGSPRLVLVRALCLIIGKALMSSLSKSVCPVVGRQPTQNREAGSDQEVSER